MTTKLIEAYTATFPMWGILLVTAGVVVISAFYLYYKAGMSIDTALSLQFLWFLVPILLLLAYLPDEGIYPGIFGPGVVQKVLEITGHLGSGIVLGSFLAFCLYVVGMTVKKFRQVV